MCHTPIVIRATWALFQQFDNEIIYPWNRGRHVQLMISERVLTRWRRLATHLLHWAMHVVLPPHRDGHQNDQQSGYILHNCCVDCCPGGRPGDTEWVVTRWRRSVASASGEALVMLHRVMNAILHRRTAMAIKMACNGGAFVCCYRLFCLTLL
jgi:hypothetical protein